MGKPLKPSEHQNKIVRRQPRGRIMPVETESGPIDRVRDGINVGRRLHEMRIGQHQTIRTLAAQSGLNANTLSLIENGKTSPSVSTLQLLASALRVPITAFFGTDSPKTNVVYQKFGQHPKVALSHGILEDLGAGITGGGAEPFVVILEPGADSGSRPIVHAGREFVYCLAGCLVYTIEDRTYKLESGDSLLFEAQLPHRWQNLGVVASRSMLVLCPEEGHERLTERHFITE
jgi:transcriptional regulator with XRE-family HTH domain